MIKFGGQQRLAEKRSWRAWSALAMASAGLGVSYVTLIPGPANEAIAAAIADPLALLALRSPGERSTGALNQTKVAKHIPEIASPNLAALVPTERVLSNVRSRPEGASPTSFPLYDVPIVLPVGLVSTPTGAADGLSLGSPASLIAPSPSPIFGGGSGGGGLAGGIGPIDVPVGTQPNPGSEVSGVPEPATWLTMIVGFFGVGLALRSPRRKGRSPAQSG